MMTPSLTGRGRGDDVTLKQHVEVIILTTLRCYDGNVSEAARHLGVARSTVQRYKRRDWLTDVSYF